MVEHCPPVLIRSEESPYGLSKCANLKLHRMLWELLNGHSVQ